MTKHYAGPYGYDYYFGNDGVLYGQPSLASGVFAPNDDECIPVHEFAEPLTEEQLDEVRKALI